MTDFWARYKRKYITEPMLRRNCYYELGETLRKKLEHFESKDCSGERYGDHFTWEEFYQIFTITTTMRNFVYKDVKISIMNYGKYADLCIEEKEVYEKYDTAQKLLDGVRIGGRSLQEIWADLIICL